MADGVPANAGSGGVKFAAREVTYSGETMQATVNGLVKFSGSDDAKTVTDVNPASEDKQDLHTTAFGALTETAPATDTASSGLNGRLQRLSQRLTTLLAQTTGRYTVATKSSFTRPADTTAYAVGDLVANSTVAASVNAGSWTGATFTGSGGGTGKINGIGISVAASTTVKTFRVHLFTAAPTMTNGDNGVFAVTSFDLDTHLGYVDVLLDTINGSGSIGYAQCDVDYQIASGDTLYYRIETRTIFTPASADTFAVKVKFERLS